MWLPSSVHKYCDSPCDTSSTVPVQAGTHERPDGESARVCERVVVAFVVLPHAQIQGI